MTEFEPTQPSGVSRRTVTKAMAWAVPVIAVASPVPAFAASKPIIPGFAGGTFCKHPGNPKYYHALLTFRNTTAASIVVTLNTLAVGADVRPARFSSGGALVATYTIPATTTLCLYVDSGLFPNSANGAAIFTFSYPGSGGLVQIGTGNVDDGDLPPCGTGADPSNPKQPSGDPAHASSGECQIAP